MSATAGRRRILRISLEDAIIMPKQRAMARVFEFSCTVWKQSTFHLVRAFSKIHKLSLPKSSVLGLSSLLGVWTREK